MASQTMLAGMKFSITGTPNSHVRAMPIIEVPKLLNQYQYQYALLVNMQVT